MFVQTFFNTTGADSFDVDAQPGAYGGFDHMNQSQKLSLQKGILKAGVE